MGWAKYHEDNESIYIGRMVMLESIPARKFQYVKPEIENETSDKTIKAKNAVLEICATDASRRKGLRLFLLTEVEEKKLRRLQLNGWWWSKANACWCNSNTSGNLAFAKKFIGNGAGLSIG